MYEYRLRSDHVIMEDSRRTKIALRSLITGCQLASNRDERSKSARLNSIGEAQMDRRSAGLR